MSDFDLWALQGLLAKRPEFAHLRVQKRGDTLIVLSGPKDDALKHFRLHALPAQRWALAFFIRAGRWESTPMEGSMPELVEMLVTQFPWALANAGYLECELGEWRTIKATPNCQSAPPMGGGSTCSPTTRWSCPTRPALEASRSWGHERGSVEVMSC